MNNSINIKPLDCMTDYQLYQRTTDGKWRARSKCTYTYKIEGITYLSAKFAADELDVSIEKVYFRTKSNTYPEWTRIPCLI